MATAAIAIPLVVAGLLLLPASVITAIFGLIMAVGAREWGRLIGAGGLVSHALVITIIAVVAVYVGVIIGAPAISSTVYTVGVLLGVFASLVGIWLLMRPRAMFSQRLIQGWPGSVWGICVFTGAVATVAALSSDVGGGGLVLAFFVLIWLVDSAGFIAGKSIGGRKLIPTISPGKTIVGAVAGVVVAAAAAAIYGVATASAGAFIVFGLVGAVLAIVAIWGDLTISFLKRRAGLADTGALFPGHGGMLDRFDGLVFAAPWCALLLQWLTVSA
ncbi:phosphatidate cytidylyltransferase [Salinisphaera orenii]|uniref:phosphatidate cytidylyltransferase n=1 Tax=Salinisphaera orenii TaxID=856731 RepID=UPI0013A671EC